MSSGISADARPVNNEQVAPAQPTVVTERAARKRDALALAELAYDIYKAKQASGKMPNGRNNAQPPSKD